MKKLGRILILLIFLGNIIAMPLSSKAIVIEENRQPPYAKWGQLAMEKTKEKYPNANIVDYLHIGRVQGTNTTMEKFKLWLKEKEKEFGVEVHIEFDKDTEKVISITFKEVTS